VTVRLYDSKAQALRDFVPLREGRVGMYVCGPTVQSSPHIGHLRSALAYDILRRWFSYRGYDVTFVRNVTDIDDKILRKSAEAGRPWWAWATQNEAAFTWAYDTLGCQRPTYEPLLRIPEMLGCRVRRFDRRFRAGYGVDLDRFRSKVTRRTRLAIVTNLHNPSGVRIPIDTLRAMAAALARVRGYLLVDEVYLECLFSAKTDSCVHAGPNVLTTNSLTKAYGLDGLRAGWILGPPALAARAGRINDLLTNNSVAPGEQMTLAAFKRLAAIDRRAHALLDPNLATLRRFLAKEHRLGAALPDGGSIAFLRLPRRVNADRLADQLLRRYATLVVPGRFFESPGCIRISFGCKPAVLARGLANISRALDDLGA